MLMLETESGPQTVALKITVPALTAAIVVAIFGLAGST